MREREGERDSPEILQRFTRGSITSPTSFFYFIFLFVCVCVCVNNYNFTCISKGTSFFMLLTSLVVLCFALPNPILKIQVSVFFE